MAMVEVMVVVVMVVVVTVVAMDKVKKKNQFKQFLLTNSFMILLVQALIQFSKYSKNTDSYSSAINNIYCHSVFHW